MKILFKKLNENAVMPKKKTDGAIAFDVYVPEDVRVRRGRQVIPLGFAIELPIGYEAKIEPRSGFSAKGMEGYLKEYSQGMERFNCDVISGKVDSDYRGEVGVIINNNDCPFYLQEGTRIAQMTIYHSDPDWEFVETDTLTDTERGDGGYGHTGATDKEGGEA